MHRQVDKAPRVGKGGKLSKALQEEPQVIYVGTVYVLIHMVWP